MLVDAIVNDEINKIWGEAGWHSNEISIRYEAPKNLRTLQI
jgi:hypothetical protein